MIDTNKKPHPITFSLSQLETDFIYIMAEDIYNCPIRSRGRSATQILNAVKAGVILEFALERQGATKNPAPFDKANRDSYAWDVEWNGLKTEVKRKNFLTKDKTRYYSWSNPEYVQTFLRNIDIVEQLIVGDYVEVAKNTYTVEWMLMSRVGKNFKKYIKESMYNRGQLYYNHLQDPNCNYLM